MKLNHVLLSRVIHKACLLSVIQLGRMSSFDQYPTNNGRSSESYTGNPILRSQIMARLGFFNDVYSPKCI